ncbi:hypothetical protein CONPUDRAFT_93831 [Coniophora puteana RWD-64-598 SS2]|uniref:Uncharacterized protein n=1 Tax=Coniophora puteana (strain RWD-64-598) TaxID=741705 RepID=R7SER1_CONPW|nr:uncharacterized protein CONPUDRAFT_93831 [Coniophora puteana RWD-64-598 SS2]EIW74666.1 hypothetical protein CONPUDRAFT_93831 [Coniophora puteana RWD-64-598 SS2]
MSVVEKLPGCSSPNAAVFGLSILGLRWLCHLLHFFMIVLHSVLIGIYIPYRARRLIVPVTQDRWWLPTALSVSLQAFYTARILSIYGTVLVALIQHLGLIYILEQKQKLTALADASSAWSGLGSAIAGLWNNARLPAHMASSALITIYLTCTLALHVVGSSVMSLEAFNDTIAVHVPTKTSWSGSSAASLEETFDGSGLDWQTIDEIVPGMAHMDSLTVQGLSGPSVYDTVIQPSMAMGIAQVNASTISFECGLIPSRNLSVTSNTGVDQVLLSELSAMVAGSGELAIDVLYMLTTGLAPFESASAVDDYAVALNWSYCSGGGCPNGIMNKEVRTFFAGCSMSATSEIVSLDVQTNVLQITSSKARDQQGAWKELPEGGALRKAPQSNTTIHGMSSDYTIPLMDYYLMQQLGIDIAGAPYQISKVYNQGPPEPTYVLNVTDLEDALAEMVAAMLWTGSQLSGGGYELPTGSTIALQSVLAWNLKLLIAFFSSLIMLCLAIRLGGIRNRGKSPSILSVGVLEMIWLADHDPLMRSKVGEVENPTVDNLRAAGMFEVCFTDV